MNIKSLRLFRLIVLHGSLAAAAERLHLSQSAASRLISLLEDEIKLTLFTRSHRRLSLTTEGEFFYQEAEQILISIDEIPRITADIRNKTRQHFTLVTSVPQGTCLVSPAITEMRHRIPDLDCRIYIEGRFDIENKVARRRYNLGFISLPVTNATVDLCITPVLQARVEVLLPKNHTLAIQKTLTAEDISREPMISLQSHQLWRRRLEEVFSSIGTTPDIKIETTSTLMVQQLVRDGNGLSIMDRTSAREENEDKAVFRPLLPERWVTYACIHPVTGQPPLIDSFIDSLHAYILKISRENPSIRDSFKLIKPE